MSKIDEDPIEAIKAGPTYINQNKKYGLIIPNKQGPQTTKLITKSKQNVKPCIFDDEDDLAEDEDDKASNKANKKPMLHLVNTSSSLLKKQTQIQLEKALKEDQTVFEYDSIYDELEKEKAKLDPKQKHKNESKEPKYIVGIMKAAAKRKMEYEKIQERKIHKEREAEGDLWSDKEVFVTTAYRQKMEERQRIEEEERRQEEIENLLDVKKQKDLSGFYYSMLRMKTGELVIEEEGEKEKRLEREKQEAFKFKEKASKGSQQAKIYRSKNEESGGEEEEEKNENENVEKPEEEEIQPIVSVEEVETKEFKEPLPKKTKTEEDDKEKKIVDVKPEIKELKETKHETEIEKEKSKKMSKEEDKRLRLEKLFKKRTVDQKFNDELNDYFIRKSQKLSLKDYIERE